MTQSSEWIEVTPQLKVEISSDSSVVHVRMQGELDESSNLDTLLTRILDPANAASILSLSLQEVTGVNSTGAKQWIDFLDSLSAKYQLKFASVSEPFIELAGLVPVVLGKKGTLIEKIELPFYCGKCSVRTTQFVSVGSIAHEHGSFKAPEARCEKCNEALLFDGDEVGYGRVLSYAGV